MKREQCAWLNLPSLCLLIWIIFILPDASAVAIKMPELVFCKIASLTKELSGFEATPLIT